jgi:PTH1 family peptidyl-tRNA hydrolase
MMRVDWLIVGLGNPGDKYENTRHNIGWMVCNELIRRNKGSWEKGPGEYVQCSLKLFGKSVLVILPLTYMNASGKAAASVASQYKCSSDKIIAVVDEYNFPTGKVHLKMGGSDGGHNGIASLIEDLRTDRFWRLRCGIDRNFGPGQLVDYVLSPFGADEREKRDAMILRGAEAIEHVMSAGIQRAPSAINSDQPLR